MRAPLLLSAGLCMAAGGCGSDAVELGPPQRCAVPVDGRDRLAEQSEVRGLPDRFEVTATTGGGCNYEPGALASEDLDGDGDPDLVLGNPAGHPFVFGNDGFGGWTEVEPADDVAAAFAALDRAWLSVGIVDLDGDRLPELSLTGLGIAVTLPNLGDLRFGEPRVAWMEEDWPRTCFHTHSWGDADGDGDLDLALGGLDPVPEPDFVPTEVIPATGTESFVLLRDGYDYERGPLLSLPSRPWLTQLVHWTDFDGDGDQDVLMGTDRFARGAPPMRLLQRDGGQWSDVAPDTGADAYIAAMGVAATDLNGDGRLDYCMTDAAVDVPCLVSQGDGFVIAGAAQGLVTDAYEAPGWPQAGGSWVGWSVEFLDVDNDGRLDAAATAGRPPDYGTIHRSTVQAVQPDTLWFGQDDGSFDAASALSGFDDPADHYGMAAVDVEGDGYLELLVGVAEGRPQHWDNPCGAAAWTAVELFGPPGNPRGLGAQVTVHTARTQRTLEVGSVRALGQSPARLTYGLGGAARVSRVEVAWPDGERTVATGLPTRRLLGIRHPDADDG